MKKDSETISVTKDQVFLDSSEESMEEILASIRKIMDPDTQPLLDCKKESLPSHQTFTKISQEKTALQPNIPSGDTLVLTKKIVPSQKEKKPDILSHENSFGEKERSGSHFPMLPGKNSLEALVISSMSPLIERWLEKNLPNIVEKVVKDEIKKIFQL